MVLWVHRLLRSRQGMLSAGQQEPGPPLRQDIEDVIHYGFKVSCWLMRYTTFRLPLQTGQSTAWSAGLKAIAVLKAHPRVPAAAW